MRRFHALPYQSHQSTLDVSDSRIHLVEFVDSFGFYEAVGYRCGQYTLVRSGIWGTKVVPSCPKCLEWFRGYMLQLPLPFPNRYSLRMGMAWYDPKSAHPVPEWAGLVFLP